MASKESNLPALYVELNKLGQSVDYERALKVVNRSKSAELVLFFEIKQDYVVTIIDVSLATVVLFYSSSIFGTSGST